MSYAWTQEATREGAQQAERIPAGKHRLRIGGIVYGARSGLFTSRDGSPQILVVFQDREAREAGQMITLSHKAGWVLAKLMAAFDPPANLARMEEAGVEPVHFANQEFADKNLTGRELTAVVEWEKGKDGKEYANITPVPVRGDAAVEGPPPSDAPPPADDGPPPPDDQPPPAGMTREEAWQVVLNSWGDDPETKTRRNQTWTEQCRQIGKQQADFTPEDWARVAEASKVPF